MGDCQAKYSLKLDYDFRFEAIIFD